MTYFQAGILGLIQGLTEFLPVSSSGHLILVPSIFGWELQDLSFDVMLHLSTALAVLIYFGKDWIEMISSLFNDISEKNFSYKTLRRPSAVLVGILIATIPVGLVGILMDDLIEEIFRSPIFVATSLLIVSIIMLWADLYARRRSNAKSESSFVDVLLISLSQIFALIPGASRSGMTISTGLFRGLNREHAAKISFLLATPIILGAAMLKMSDILMIDRSLIGPYVVGFLVSFASGLLAINWLLKFLRSGTLVPFVIYRIVVAIIVFALFI